MGIEIYNSNSTFVWPEDTTHVEAYAFGGGAGGASGSVNGAGGGGGGAFMYAEIYRLGESSLSIAVGNGGNQNAAGADSSVTRDGTTVLRAKGGGAPAGVSGGVGGLVASGVGQGGTNGGNGGHGYFGRGGGGGGGGGGNGEDATTPDNPANHGAGGVPTPHTYSGGRGGAGGNFSFNGQAGFAPGGGGGGGSATGPSGGSGGQGRVILVWGSDTGTTRFSSGCCCGACDLTKTQLPENITVTINTTPFTPDDFNPWPTEAAEIDYDVTLGCDPYADPTHIHYDAVPYDAVVLDHTRTNFMNGKEVVLEQTNFIGRVASTSFPFINDGTVETYHECYWSYECPMADPSINDGARPGVGWGGDLRWCLLGDDPSPGYDVPVWTHCDEDETCFVSAVHEWVRRGEVRCRCHVSISILRRFADGKFGFRKTISFVAFSQQSGGSYSTPGPVGELPTTDGWTLKWFVGDAWSWYLPPGADISITGEVECSQLYDTSSEAMDAAKEAVIELNGATYMHAVWFPGGPTYHLLWGNPFIAWRRSNECVECDRLPNGFFVCGNSTETWEANPLAVQEYHDHATCTFEVTW